MQEVLSEEQNLSLSQDISLQGQKQRISKQTLVKIVSAAQERQFAEEIDELENIEGMEGIESGLQTNFEKGLKGDDFKERNLFYGTNQSIINSSKKTYVQMVQSNLEDYLIQILLVASILQIIIGVITADENCRSLAWIEGFSLFIAVFLCCNVTAIYDYQKEKQFQNLDERKDTLQTVIVLRDGEKIQLNQNQIMIGDIIYLFEGMQIPVDGFVIEAEQLKVDESSITGETESIKKDTYKNCKYKRDQLSDEKNCLTKFDIPSPVLLSGTRILSGECKMVAAVVGESSCIAKISSLFQTEDVQQSPLQLKLEIIAQSIGKLGLIFSVIIFFILLSRFIFQRIIEDSFEKEHIKEILNLSIVPITIIIISIPDGFPVALTLCIAFSVKRMLKDNILVRKLSTCEILGDINIVCSDKTGTLTQNKLRMVNIWNDNKMDIDVYSEKLNLNKYLPHQMHELFIQSSIVNGTAEIRPQERGSQTDVAMILFIEQCGFNYQNERDLHESTQNMPFSSRRKRMSRVIGDKRLVIKGSSEIILNCCNKIHSKSKGIIPIDSTIRKQIEDFSEQMNFQAIRTIGLAYKELNGNEDLVSKNEHEVYDIETENLILIAIVGFKDVLRAETPQAITDLQIAGINVKMTTGDNKITAKAIAKDCGILIDENQSLVLEGYDFNQRIGGIVCKWCRTSVCDCPRDQSNAKLLTKQIRVDTIENGEEFDKVYPKLDVLARSRPEDKYALVIGLQERGYVVAVTGDGTNDAPSLHKADVGIALGISATEIARESASIILLDDNFSSIVKIVLWGRNIYDSIKKFIQFQLTAIIVVVIITLSSSILIKQEVFKPIQMLWINIIIDSFASLSLATETPYQGLLKRQYYNRNESLICPKMFKHIIGQAIYQIIIILILIFYAHTFIPEFKGQEDESQDYFDKLQYKYSNTYFDVNNKLHICPNHQDYCNLISYNTEYNINGSENYLSFYKKTYIPSRQFTVIFNTFVMMQLFNFINARRIQDELNILQGIFSNILFPIIFLGILSLQIIMITFGGIVFHCYSFNGLCIEQWLICIAFGFGGLIIRLILSQIPDTILGFLVIYISKKNPNYQLQIPGHESETENLRNPNQENS
ncbi:unnamed protein product [Paramecium pentaurelia]|uniref:Calcium-transporting ATPase n=1 Tax=Paramecium pentaurelia TaxID=43138 RepID=A0A8S1VUY2_9CILI|nr:unnamed protein product [Paramecium pentaurelia]